MTKKEIVNRNIGLTFDFVREIIKDPSIMDNIPDGAVLEFVDKDFPVSNDLTNKYIIKVKNTFEPVNKVAEPQAKYGKKNKPLL